VTDRCELLEGEAAHAFAAADALIDLAVSVSAAGCWWLA
jgi:hypothetical protein